MHPAHVLPPEHVSIGAGMSGQFAVETHVSELDPVAARVVHEAAFSPGLAPWVSGRMGIEGDLEAGLTYAGRSIRLDLRRAFELDGPTLSIGLGASGVLPKRRDDLGFRVGGGGGDLPILIGYRSDSEIFALWLGARGGFELLDGHLELDVDPTAPIDTPLVEDISGWHTYAGGLAGLRVGFRHVFAALELSAAMHWADGDVGAESATMRQFGLAPAGALIVKF